MDYKILSIFQRDYSKFLSQQFCDDVSIQNWNTNLPNVNSLFIDFYSKLQGSVDRHAPYKKLSPKEIKLQSKPWISTEIFKFRNRSGIKSLPERKDSQTMPILKGYIIYLGTGLLVKLRKAKKKNIQNSLR